jgi:hypothetical protein
MSRHPVDGIAGSKPRVPGVKSTEKANGEVSKAELSALNREYLAARNRAQQAKAESAEIALDEKKGTLIWVRDGGGNEPSNLLALCPNCHALHTRAHIPQEAIRIWKGMLIALNSTNRNSIDILIYLYHRHNDFFGRHIRYSADTALQLAGLINSGLLEIASATIASEYEGKIRPSAFDIRLTGKGSMMVEAWLAGNETQLNAALTQQ